MVADQFWEGYMGFLHSSWTIYSPECTFSDAEDLTDMAAIRYSAAAAHETCFFDPGRRQIENQHERNCKSLEALCSPKTTYRNLYDSAYYLGIFGCHFSGPTSGGWKVMSWKQSAWDVEKRWETAARNSSGGHEPLHTPDFLKARSVRSLALRGRVVSWEKTGGSSDNRQLLTSRTVNAAELMLVILFLHLRKISSWHQHHLGEHQMHSRLNCHESQWVLAAFGNASAFWVFQSPDCGISGRKAAQNHVYKKFQLIMA